MNVQHRIELIADHFQILFGDSEQAPLIDTTTLWDSPGRVASLPGISELVGIGTVRYGGATQLTIRIEDSPQVLLSGWQLMGRFEVNVPSGRLIFWGPELEEISQAPGVKLPSGRYEGLAFSQRTELVVDEMAADGPDEYLIALWRN